MVAKDDSAASDRDILVAKLADALPDEETPRRRGRPPKKQRLVVPQFPKEVTGLAHYMAEDFLQARFSDASALLCIRGQLP